MKPLPVDTSDFLKIRNKNLLYVDKTSFLYKLVNGQNGDLFFVSRPRRFGKSLMISTLEAIFNGRKDLFEGLDISRTDYDWKVHPVISLNMSKCSHGDAISFSHSIATHIKEVIIGLGLDYDPTIDFADNFRQAINTLAAKGAAPVILIDEYDDPVAQVIDTPDEAEKVRNLLAPLYRQIKECEGNIRFVMITGVSKFTKMSIFSALSKLQDISFDDDYAAMLGFTEAELDTYYSEYMELHAQKMKLTLEQYKSELRRMYNGYRFWAEDGEKVYNPVSINLTMAKRLGWFKCYWTDTGRPSMLMNILKRENILAIEPERVPGATQRDFDVTDFHDIPVKGLLFQTGYLTITDFNPLTQMYTLGIPDEEIRQDFALLMSSLCAKKSVAWAAELGGQLLTFDWDHFFTGLKSLYAGVAYGPQEKRIHEYSYARCLLFLLQGQGIVCTQEKTQAGGRVDLVCTHPCAIFIFELKVDKPASMAMTQIEQKQYTAPYASDSRPIWLVGLSFCSQNRMLVDCICQQYRP